MIDSTYNDWVIDGAESSPELLRQLAEDAAPARIDRGEAERAIAAYWGMWLDAKRVSLVEVGEMRIGWDVDAEKLTFHPMTEVRHDDTCGLAT
jgi:hypothetical protein